MRATNSWAGGGLLFVAAGCGGGGGGSHPAPKPVVRVVSPAADAEVSRGGRVEIRFTCEFAAGNAVTKVVADRDGVLATTADAIVLASGLPETGPVPAPVVWDTDGVALGDYTVFAVASHGETSDVVARAAGRLKIGNVSFARSLTGRAGGIAALPDGSTIVAGSFVGELALGAGEPGATTLAATGGASDQDVFVARYDPHGALQWARRVGGPEADRCDVLSATSDGSFVVAGLFRSTAVFGAGEAGATTLVGSVNETFVASYRPDGTLAWARATASIPPSGLALAAAASLLPDGSSVVTGVLQAGVRFGPGEPGETTLTSVAGSYDVYVARFAPDGALAWARSAGGDGNEYVNSVATLSDGASVIAGTFRGDAVFGAGELGETALATDYYQMYVARYDAAGALEWVVHTDEYEYAGDEGYAAGATVAANPDDSVLVVGTFFGTVLFGAGSSGDVLRKALSDNGDGFVARYEPDGSVAWVRRVVTGLYPYAGVGQVVPTADGGYVVSGALTAPTTVAPDVPGATVLAPTPSTVSDALVAKFDADGDLAWVRQAGGLGMDQVSGLVAFPDGSVAVRGLYHATAVFGAGDPHETTLVTTAPGGDAFFARLNADGGF